VPPRLTILATLIVLAMPAAAARAAPRVRFGTGQANSALRFWTEARMRSARPLSMPRAARTAPEPASPRPAPGPPTLVPRHAPLPRSMIVPDPTVPPYPEQGRLFIRFGRIAGSCSATLVNTPSQRVAITAGHCLHEGFGRLGQWATAAVFVPGYHNGQRPFGNFAGRGAEVLGPWFGFQNDDYDVGAVVLAPNRLGRPGDVVGSRGWATGLGRRQFFQIFGYPAGASRGQTLRECDSGFHGLDHSTFPMPGPPTSRIRCDMAAGSSGGGWIIHSTTLNGLISYFYPARRGFMYGPYFGRAVRALIRNQP
jgi:hypothetical protein